MKMSHEDEAARAVFYNPFCTNDTNETCNRYAWVTTFALEMLTAASITEFWGLDHVGIGVIFYVAFPVFCIVINSINVKVLPCSNISLLSVMKLS